MNKPLVLVVEDDTPVRNLITTTLKTHEYRYLSAQNGASAVMEALSHNPDIVLLDLGLPDMDGVEIIRKIHSWSNMPFAPIIFEKPLFFFMIIPPCCSGFEIQVYSQRMLHISECHSVWFLLPLPHR